LMKRCYFLPSFKIGAIKSNIITNISIRRSKCFTIACIPAIDRLLIKCMDCSLVIWWNHSWKAASLFLLLCYHYHFLPSCSKITSQHILRSKLDKVQVCKQFISLLDYCILSLLEIYWWLLIPWGLDYHYNNTHLDHISLLKLLLFCRCY
jgi:hypothetical protein